MNIVIIVLLVVALVLFILASTDGDSKKGYMGLASWVLAEILQRVV